MSFSDAASDSDLLTDALGSENAALKAKPFLKWAGGKAQLIPEIKKRLPLKYNRYFEPFIGGGAVFFNLCHGSSYISDINEELINCYGVVRDSPQELIEEIKLFTHDKNSFYKIRNIDRLAEYESWSNIKKAARLVFLNRTCFNGLYRVNSKGHFNVPFGDYKNPRIIDVSNLYACSALLSKSEIACASYLEIENRVKKGDFVYFDPPYQPLSKTSNFIAYSKFAFGEEQQIELKELCARLNVKGVLWMLSNSSSIFIEDLYSEFNKERVAARRNINSIGSGRGVIDELLVKNY